MSGGTEISLTERGFGLSKPRRQALRCIRNEGEGIPHICSATLQTPECCGHREIFLGGTQHIHQTIECCTRTGTFALQDEFPLSCDIAHDCLFTEMNPLRLCVGIRIKVVGREMAIVRSPKFMEQEFKVAV